MTDQLIRTVTHDQGAVRPLSDAETSAVSGAGGGYGSTRPTGDTLSWNNFGTHKDIDD